MWPESNILRLDGDAFCTVEVERQRCYGPPVTP